jgi:DNA-binding MarR family transcriptional regulator
MNKSVESGIRQEIESNNQQISAFQERNRNLRQAIKLLKGSAVSSNGDMPKRQTVRRASHENKTLVMNYLKNNRDGVTTQIRDDLQMANSSLHQAINSLIKDGVVVQVFNDTGIKGNRYALNGTTLPLVHRNVRESAAMSAYVLTLGKDLKQNGPSRAKDISERTNIPHSSMYKALNIGEQQGWIKVETVEQGRKLYTFVEREARIRAGHGVEEGRKVQA